MNSEWFLFKGSHHVGPFSTQEIEMMFRRGDINRTVLTWKEGEVRWEPLFKIEDFKHLFIQEEKKEEIKINEDTKANGLTSVLTIEVPPLPEIVEEMKLPPDLPPELPIEVTSKKNVEPNKKLPSIPDFKKVVDASESLPPPLPMDALMPPPLPHSTVRDGDELFFTEERRKFTGIKNRDYTKWSLLFMGAIFVGIIIWQVIFESGSEVHFKIRNLMPQYVEKLEAMASQVSTRPNLAFALSMNGRTVFIASNFSRELDLTIKLTPIKGRILGKTDGVFYLKGRVFDHLGEFDNVYLSKGQDFPPGEYSYDVQLTEHNFLNTYFPVLGPLPFFNKLNRRHRLQGRTLLFASSPKEFENRLNRYKEDATRSLVRPVQEQLEVINTFISLLEKCEQNYEAVVMKAQKFSDLKEFESLYIKEVAPMLQTMVVEEPNPNAKFNHFIKDVSGVSLIMVEGLSKINNWKKIDKSQLILANKKLTDPIKQNLLETKSSLESIEKAMKQ